MLFALGLGDQTIGVTHECDFPPAATELPRLTATAMPEGLSAGEIDAAVKQIVGEGRALYSLDEERLAALAPDLIVTQAVCEVCAVSYEDVVEVAARLPDPPRVLQQDPSSLAEVLADLTRLGEAAGVDSRAAAVRAGLEKRLGAVRTAVAGATTPRVVTLEWLDPPYVGGHWVPELAELAGGVDVAGPRGAKSPEVPWERLAELRPEAVVVMPCGMYARDSRAEAERHRGRIAVLGATRVFAVDAASTYSRPGPRLVDGVELLAHLLHPDRVEAPAGIDFVDLSAEFARA
ncbi:MAG TPA: ABC transporter substrate-binding protein [Solirubrobacterales bacterium]|jgi:iron complex transport system substrate-binding protein